MLSENSKKNMKEIRWSEKGQKPFQKHIKKFKMIKLANNKISK